jgi:hypothetical protein
MAMDRALLPLFKAPATLCSTESFALARDNNPHRYFFMELKSDAIPGWHTPFTNGL